MTSPVQDKPDNTTSIYADVYAPGLSNGYGQNLRKGTTAETERAVKELFLQQAASPFDNALGNFTDFAGRILKEIADAIGAILGGAVNAGAAVFGVVVDGVAGFIQGIATFIANIFDRWSGRKSPEPLPPVYSQIETDLEAATQPMFDAVDLSIEKADEALDKAETLRTTIADTLAEVDENVAAAKALVDETKNAQAAINTAAQNALSRANAAWTLADQATKDAKVVSDQLPSITSKMGDLEAQQAAISEDLADASAATQTATTKAEGAVTAANKALTDLRNTVEPGLSLVPMIPGTTEPRWAEGVDKVAIDGTPEMVGITHAYTRSERKISSPSTQWVLANPSQKYKVSFWARASVAGTQVFIELRDQDGAHAVKSGAIGGGALYLANNLALPTEWTKFESVITLHDKVQRVRPAAIFWNHSNGTAVGQQWIADLRIDPVIPTQEAVDAAQNKAIEANTEALKFQAWWNAEQTAYNNAQAVVNELNKAGWDTQAKINAAKDKIDTAQNDAIRANTDLARLAFPHLDMTPKASNGLPMWLLGVNSIGTVVLSENLKVWVCKITSTSNGTTNLSDNSYFTTAPGMDLRVRFAVRAAETANNPLFNFRLYNKEGTRVISETKLLAEGPLRDLTPVKDPQWVAEPKFRFERSIPEKGTWWEYDVAIRLVEGTDAARIQVMTHYNEIDFAGPHIGAYFPLQAETDKAQNNAINGLNEAVKASDAVLEQHQVALEEISSASKTLMTAMGEIEEFIPRLLVVPDAGYGASSSKPYLRSPHVQVRFDSSSDLLVDARGTSWMGLIVVTANYQTDPSATSKHGLTKYYEFPVVAGQGRTFNIPRKGSFGGHGDLYSARIDYFVQKGTIQDRNANESFSPPMIAPAEPAWSQRTALRFPVEATETTQHTIEYKVRWYSAARDDAVYKIRITKTGPSGTTVIKTFSRALLGPTFPWEDGRRTTTLLWNGPLGPDETVNFEVTVGTTGGTVYSDQRRIYATERKISWVSNEI